MKTIEVQLYKFEELSPDVQAKLIEENRDCLTQWDDWHDPIIEGWVEDMNDRGHDIAAKDVSYSGFWSQGDGASFTTRNGRLDPRALLKQAGVKLKDLPKGIGKYLDDGSIKFWLSRSTHHYVHENTVYLDYTCDYLPERYADAIESLIEDHILENSLKDDMRDLYSRLEKYYDELHSDEAVRQELIEQENDYFETGKKF